MVRQIKPEECIDEALFTSLPKELLQENIRFIFTECFYKKHGRVEYIRKFSQPNDPLCQYATYGWKCMALPVSSLESFQFHVGMAIQMYFAWGFEMPRFWPW